VKLFLYCLLVFLICAISLLLTARIGVKTYQKGQPEKYTQSTKAISFSYVIAIPLILLFLIVLIVMEG
jgi:steroid 5-alpha reductase family enzyme